jgi:hypothetical protein
MMKIFLVVFVVMLVVGCSRAYAAPFSKKSNYMSQNGFLRWRSYQMTNHWHGR